MLIQVTHLNGTLINKFRLILCFNFITGHFAKSDRLSTLYPLHKILINPADIGIYSLQIKTHTTFDFTHDLISIFNRNCFGLNLPRVF